MLPSLICHLPKYFGGSTTSSYYYYLLTSTIDIDSANPRCFLVVVVKLLWVGAGNNAGNNGNF